MSPTVRPVELFKDPIYRRYWFGGLADNFGWQVQIVGASWIMATLDGRPAMVSLVQSAFALPLMLLAITGGTLGDLFGRKRLVIYGQSFLLFPAFVLMALSASGTVTPIILLIGTFLLGAGRALYYPGWQALVFELLSREKAPTAVGLGSITMQLARSAGPAIGGMIVAATGTFSTFLIGIIGNLFVLKVARDLPLPSIARGSIPRDLGLSAALNGFLASRALKRIALRGFLFNASTSILIALLPLYVQDELKRGPEIYGILLAALGLGGGLGALCSAFLPAKFRFETFMSLHLTGFSLSLIALYFAPSTALAFCAIGMAGFSWIMAQVRLSVASQICAPEALLGRFIAIYLTCAHGGVAFGSLVWGAFAAQFGTLTALLIAAAATFSLTLFHVFAPLVERDLRLDETPTPPP